MKFTLEPASDGKHKWVGVFTNPATKDERRVSFGAKGYEDYTQHHDKLRRENYLSRHRARENWNDPQTAGALSKWILWGESTSLPVNVRSFKRRFGLE
jgi:hypothetical protein